MEIQTNTENLRMDINRAEFALELKTWRLRHDLSQEQLAKRWGTNRWLIMHAEAARDITWENAYKLFAKLAYELRQER